jgi:hypothetical protein
LISSKVLLGIGSGFAIALCGSFGYVWLSSATERPVTAPVAAAAVRAPSPSLQPRGSASALAPAPSASDRAAQELSGTPPAVRFPVPVTPRRAVKTISSNSTEAGPDVEGEVALLAEAQKALAAGNPARALQFLDEHATTYPRGALGPERGVVRVVALCKLGRFAAARRDAAAFLNEDATSPLADRIRAACGEAVVRPPP